MGKMYQGDVGTVLQVNVGDDMSSATTVELSILKPDLTTEVWDAIVNGVDNTQIDHTIITDELDQVGRYGVQAHIVISGWSGLGETTEFIVHEAFQ